MNVGNHSVKKKPYMIELMAQAHPPRESSTVKKMNGRSLLLSLNKITHYFKDWTSTSCVLKKIFFPYKNLML